MGNYFFFGGAVVTGVESVIRRFPNSLVPCGRIHGRASKCKWKYKKEHDGA
jgi:hypothetical protein